MVGGLEAFSGLWTRSVEARVMWGLLRSTLTFRVSFFRSSESEMIEA